MCGGHPVYCRLCGSVLVHTQKLVAPLPMTVRPELSPDFTKCALGVKSPWLSSISRNPHPFVSFCVTIHESTVATFILPAQTFLLSRRLSNSIWSSPQSRGRLRSALYTWTHLLPSVCAPEMPNLSTWHHHTLKPPVQGRRASHPTSNPAQVPLIALREATPSLSPHLLSGAPVSPALGSTAS